MKKKKNQKWKKKRKKEDILAAKTGAVRLIHQPVWLGEKHPQPGRRSKIQAGITGGLCSEWSTRGYDQCTMAQREEQYGTVYERARGIPILLALGEKWEANNGDIINEEVKRYIRFDIVFYCVFFWYCACAVIIHNGRHQSSTAPQSSLPFWLWPFYLFLYF